MKTLYILGILLFAFTGIGAQRLLVPSDTGSKVHFVIKNFGIKTGGDFRGLKGAIKFDPNNISASTFDVTVNVSTVDTDNSRRDKHLRDDDFFDMAKYPIIKITSSKIEPTTDASTFLFTGNITIKNITKSVSFPFTISRLNGGYIFTGGFEVSRKDYAVGNNSATMSDDVEISLSVFAK